MRNLLQLYITLLILGLSHYGISQVCYAQDKEDGFHFLSTADALTCQVTTERIRSCEDGNRCNFSAVLSLDGRYLYNKSSAAVTAKYEYYIYDLQNGTVDIRNIDPQKRKFSSCGAHYSEDDIIYYVGGDWAYYDVQQDTFHVFPRHPDWLKDQAKDILIHKGEFYMANNFPLHSKIGTITKLDYFDPYAHREVVLELPPTGTPNFISNLESVQYHCEDVRFLFSQVNKTYHLDLDSGTYQEECEIDIGILRTISGFPQWSSCMLSIDLDLDDQTIQTVRDFEYTSQCSHTALPVCDDDPQVYSSTGYIDSIQVVLQDPLTDQYLDALPLLGITIRGNMTSSVTLINEGGATFDDYETIMRSIRYMDAALDVRALMREIHYTAYHLDKVGVTSVAYLQIANEMESAGRDTMLLFCAKDTIIELMSFVTGSRNHGRWSHVKNTYNPAVDTSGQYLYIVDNGLCLDTAIFDISLVPPASVMIIDTTLCPGDTLMYRDSVFVAGEMHDFFIPYTSSSCDSLIEMIQVIAEESMTDTLRIEAPMDTTLQVTVPYAADQYTWSPDINISCSTCASADIYVDEDITYTVSSSSAEACDRYFTLMISAQEPIVEVDDVSTSIYRPNVFSPSSSNDNNRLFYLGMAEALPYDIVIYDRWGGLIYQGQQLMMNNPEDGWDGTSSDLPVTNGIYAWKAIIYMANDQQKILTGSVLVLR